YLGPDRPPAQDQETARELLRRGDVDVVPGLRLSEPLDRGHEGGGPACGDDGGARGEPPRGAAVQGLDLDRSLAGEPPVAPHRLDPLALEPRRLRPVAEVARHVVALREG